MNKFKFSLKTSMYNSNFWLQKIILRTNADDSNIRLHKTFGHMNGIRNHHLSDFIILIGTL